ncbi:hypothetical protein ACLKA7_001695 [Drosophila subpalustris]
MKIRVAKCCPFVSLRWGCFAIAFFDTSFHIVNLEMCNSDVLDIILICIYVIHALGCFLLIISAIIQMSHLVIVYLISNVVQTLFFVATVYIWINCKENSVFEIVVTFIDICNPQCLFLDCRIFISQSVQGTCARCLSR